LQFLIDFNQQFRVIQQPGFRYLANTGFLFRCKQRFIGGC
jgi:hypothetical protein